MVKVWIRELPSFQTPKLAYGNSMLGVFSCDFTVVANDVIMQRTQRCLRLSESRQVNRHIVMWLARALRALEASQHVIGLERKQIRWDTLLMCENRLFIGSSGRPRNKIMYALPRRTVYALTRRLVWCLFPSLVVNSGNPHQNKPVLSSWKVPHSSPYMILYSFLLTRYDASMDRFLETGVSASLVGIGFVGFCWYCRLSNESIAFNEQQNNV